MGGQPISYPSFFEKFDLAFELPKAKQCNDGGFLCILEGLMGTW